MTLHEGFFHAFQQDPDDDGVRLIYADFLGEQGGDESTARAEFIRIQVQLANLPPGAAHQATPLITRQNDLLAWWKRAWMGGLAGPLEGWTFRRGLVEAVQANASDFLDHAAEWFARWPTLAVAKLTNAREHLPELAVSPWLARLRGLDLSDNGIDPASLAYLTASRSTCQLQALDLSDNPIGAQGAAMLATMLSGEKLREVHLARCGLAQEGLMALVRHRPGREVGWRRLDLSGNHLYRPGVVRLASSPLMRNLESLDLSNNPLRENGASVLADSPNAAGLIDLGLCGTGSGNGEVTALTRSRNLAKLRSLDLRGNFCWGGFAELARSPLLGQLQRLLLGHSRTSNGWVAQVLTSVRPTVPPEISKNTWWADQLRTSAHLIPSQLVQCDVEALIWRGGTHNWERSPHDSGVVRGYLESFPELLDRMDGRQASVLRMRYGLGEKTRILKEIGELLGLTREQVQETEKEAVRNLRALWNSLRAEAKRT